MSRERSAPGGASAASESDLVRVRRRKLAALRERGVDPYPNDFRPSHTAAAVHAAHGGRGAEELERMAECVRIAGRMVSRRDFGRASFLHLDDGTGRLQIHLRKDLLGDEAFGLFRETDIGDFLGVAGRLFRTRTGELTVGAESFRLLVKSLRPLPEKWHGLTDVEARYRQRYLDLIANPRSREIFRCRARVIAFLREFLSARGHVEVETPVMQPIPGGAAARPFVTHHNALGIDLYLRIAPELYLKRLLVGGFPRVFELGRVFRNEGVSTRHNPEFTMLEFYEAYATYDDLMQLTEQMLAGLAREIHGGTKVRVGEREIDFAPPWRRICLPRYVAERAGLHADAFRDLEWEAVRETAGRLGFDPGIDYRDRYGDGAAGYLLTDLFEWLAAPELIEPTFVYRYPAAVSPLARRNAEWPGFVDRFELFVAGSEIANAFSELNDPEDQRRRLEAQARQKAAGDEEAQAIDEDFLRALEHGMPPAAGAGIGIDRLVMVLTGSSSIRDVLLFPLLRPERR